MNFNDSISKHLNDHQKTVEQLHEFLPFISNIAKKMIDSLNAGGKVLFFGNGGSAADAQHLAAELVVRYRQNRRALAGMALTTDTSILTAGSNDFGFDSVYERQVEALAKAGDVVIGISTSGNSMSVVRGLEAAKALGCVTVAFTAEGGGKCGEVAEFVFRAPSPVTARAQECHLLVGHILCDLIEETMLKE